MPELSSIIREPLQPINPEKEAVDSHAPQVVPAESEFYKRIYENPDAFSIFEMTLAFDMPAFDLPEIQGIPSNKDPLRRRMRKVYGLGSGVSCSLIQHQTDTGTEAVCPTGTLVALKRYTSIPSGFPGEQNANKKLRTLLFQELQVFCHPYLKEHENICKLLFIGWETTTIVPTLALELASYGTLDDCMQLLRSYGSVIRKAHLSLDVALGIEALHACGLVHGDIKPSNIIVQKHPTRTIVAKLTDFNGVSPANTYGSSTYSFGTPSWQPPEVLLNEESIDWQLGDVYSYGMVFATIWCKTGFIPVGGSFLDPVCKYELDRDARRSMLELYKYTPDDEDDSVIKLALCSAAVEEQELAFSPASVITCTLSTLPTRRRPLSMILSSHFVEFSKRTNRKIPSPVARNLALSDEVEHQEQSARSAWMINGSFLNRSKPFKENVFQALLSSASKFRNEITLPKQALGLEKGIDVTDEELLDLLRHVDQELKSAIWRDENLHHFSNQALEVALAYTLGIGTLIDEEHALEWMSLAASSGNGWAIYVFGPLERSTAKAQNCVAPRKLWCCQGVFAGYMQTAACLNDLDPELNKIAMRMHRRRYWGRTQPQIVKIEPYLPIFIERIKEDHTLVDIAAPSRRGHTDIKETALHLCAATGDIESTRYLVLNAGANVNATNERNETPVFYATRAGQFEVTKFLCSQGAMVDQISTEGFAITHCLALMDDEQAAELAPLFFEKNARIDIATEERAGDRTDRLTLGSGIPLRWAALKNQPKLFAAFLRLHSLPEQKISFVEFYHLVVVLASLNLHEMLNLVIESEADIVDLTLQPPASEEARDIESILTSMSLVSKTTVKEKLSPSSLSEIHYTSLLYEALDSRKPTLFKRRYIHRTEFRKAKDKTVALLLRLGADPIAPVHRDASGTNEGEEDDSLTLSVYTGDTASFMLFLEFMSEKKINVLPFLENPKRYGGYSALQRSIYSDSREIFMYLIEHFPTLLDSVGEHDRRPLHSAAVMTWPGYTKELLRRGVSRNVRARDGATPFTWALMRNPNIEIADILAEGVDMTEILGPCPGPQSTFTAFGKLLSGITHYKTSSQPHCAFSASVTPLLSLFTVRHTSRRNAYFANRLSFEMLIRGLPAHVCGSPSPDSLLAACHPTAATSDYKTDLRKAYSYAFRCKGLPLEPETQPHRFIHSLCGIYQRPAARFVSTWFNFRASCPYVAGG